MPSAEITFHKPTSDYRSACPNLDYFRMAARELKHVHTEVAARQAEHLGEGGLTKRELDVLQLIRNPHRNKHVYRALSVRRHLVNLASHAPSIPRHATP